MKDLFKIVLFLTLCIAGIGYFRGWFVLSGPTPDAASDKVNINLEVDQGKVKDDADALQQKTSELTGQRANDSPDQQDQDRQE